MSKREIRDIGVFEICGEKKENEIIIELGSIRGWNIKKLQTNGCF